jgi:hypothetical protein
LTSISVPGQSKSRVSPEALERYLDGPRRKPATGNAPAPEAETETVAAGSARP